jgi:hypothetical protein
VVCCTRGAGQAAHREPDTWQCSCHHNGPQANGRPLTYGGRRRMHGACSSTTAISCQRVEGLCDAEQGAAEQPAGCSRGSGDSRTDALGVHRQALTRERGHTLLTASTWAPPSSRVRITPWWPACAATCSAVMPSCSSTRAAVKCRACLRTQCMLGSDAPMPCCQFTLTSTTACAGIKYGSKGDVNTAQHSIVLERAGRCCVPRVLGWRCSTQPTPSCSKPQQTRVGSANGSSGGGPESAGCAACREVRRAECRG